MTDGIIKFPVGRQVRFSELLLASLPDHEYIGPNTVHGLLVSAWPILAAAHGAL